MKKTNIIPSQTEPGTILRLVLRTAFHGLIFWCLYLFLSTIVQYQREELGNLSVVYQNMWSPCVQTTTILACLLLVVDIAAIVADILVWKHRRTFRRNKDNIIPFPSIVSQKTMVEIILSTLIAIFLATDIRACPKADVPFVLVVVADIAELCIIAVTMIQSRIVKSILSFFIWFQAVVFSFLIYLIWFSSLTSSYPVMPIIALITELCLSVSADFRLLTFRKVS